MRRPYRSEGLTAREMKIIEIERRCGPSPTALPKKLGVAAQHGIDATTYTLVLAALVDDPRAHEVDPATMSRLKEIREQHRTPEETDDRTPPAQRFRA